MEILQYKTIPPQDLLSRLSHVKLKGHNQFPIYQNCELLVGPFDPSYLSPAQNYVLSKNVTTIYKIWTAFDQIGIDVFSLAGGLLFWTTEQDPVLDKPIPFLPPVIEESIEEDGKSHLLINDGMHRIFTAKKLNKKINCILVRNVPREYPYYAYPLANGWADVHETQQVLKEQVTKTYRDPANYKALFRDFNAVYPGIQEQRTKV